jgi:hypothetical protein
MQHVRTTTPASAASPRLASPAPLSSLVSFRPLFFDLSRTTRNMHRLITRFRRRIFHTLRSAGATPSQATLVHTPHTSGKRGQQVCDENEALALIFTGGLHRRHGSFGGAVVRAQTVQRDWTHHRRDRPYVHASLVWSCPDPRTDHSSPVPPPAAAERGARAPVFPKLCGTARHGMARRGRRPRAAIEHQYVLGGRVGLVSFSWESGFWRSVRVRRT